jgi:hypothetical protein
LVVGNDTYKEEVEKIKKCLLNFEESLNKEGLILNTIYDGLRRNPIDFEVFYNHTIEIKQNS